MVILQFIFDAGRKRIDDKDLPWDSNVWNRPVFVGQKKL